MGPPITPLPAANAFAEDGRSVLLGCLDHHRAVLGRKVEGLTDRHCGNADLLRQAIDGSTGD